MRFGRLLAVVLVVTLCGGTFGGVVGGLIGYAIPTTLDAFFQTQGAHLETDADRDVIDSDARQSGAVRVGINPESKVLSGAALGGAWGLILGAVVGLILGTLDQFVLVINRWCEVRKAGTGATDRRPV